MSKRKTQGHIRRLSTTLIGLQLAQAFVIARREGYKLCVDMIDGESILLRPHATSDKSRINVKVMNGNVAKSWVG